MKVFLPTIALATILAGQAFASVPTLHINSQGELEMAGHKVIYLNDGCADEDLPTVSLWTAVPENAVDMTRARRDADAETCDLTLSFNLSGMPFEQYAHKPTVYWYSSDYYSTYKYGWLDVVDSNGNGSWDTGEAMSASGVVPGEIYIVAFFDLSHNSNGKVIMANAFTWESMSVNAGEENVVTLDMSKTTHSLQWQPLLGDGSPFPIDVEGGTTSNLTFPSIYMPYFNGGARLNGQEYHMYVPELNDRCYVSGTSTLRYTDQPKEVYVASELIRGPFSEDIVYSNDLKDYHYWNAKFQLTPYDYEHTTLQAYGEKLNYLILNNGTVYNQIATSNSGAFGEPFTEVWSETCFAPVNDFNGRLYSGVSPLTRSQWDANAYYGEFKVSGNQIYDADGRCVITPLQIIPNDASYWWISPADDFNIYKDEQEVINFKNTLFAAAYGKLYQSGDLISYFAPSMEVKGMFHEYIASDNSGKFLTKITYDGSEISSAELVGKEYAGHNLQFSFSYDNVMVNEELFTSADVVLNVSTTTDDSTAPVLTNLQVRNSNGKIDNLLDNDGNCRLILSAADESGVNPDITLSISRHGTDNWMVLPADLDKSYFYTLGTVANAKIDTSSLSGDSWYDLKVVATDNAGNFSETTVNYLFKTHSNSGVETCDDNFNNDAIEYYNLQGVRVQTPQSGSVCLERRGSSVRKIMK